MKLTFEEKKLLYTYGCADLELTRKPLYGVAGLTVDPNQNKMVYDFCRKLEDETLADWYDQMFYFVRAEMKSRVTDISRSLSSSVPPLSHCSSLRGIR